MGQITLTEAVNSELLGALIGLGRSAEGNKNRPDAATHQLLLASIRMREKYI